MLHFSLYFSPFWKEVEFILNFIYSSCAFCLKTFIFILKSYSSHNVSVNILDKMAQCYLHHVFSLLLLFRLSNETPITLEGVQNFKSYLRVSERAPLPFLHRNTCQNLPTPKIKFGDFEKSFVTCMRFSHSYTFTYFFSNLPFRGQRSVRRCHRSLSSEKVVYVWALYVSQPCIRSPLITDIARIKVIDSPWTGH